MTDKITLDRAALAEADEASHHHPAPPELEAAINAPLAEQPAEQEPVAWLHPANASCVTTDPTAYARGIPLCKCTQAPQPAIPPGYKLVPVALLERLAPEDPMNQDEMGGCVWCAGNGGKKYGDAGRDPEDHAADCPWVEARAMLAAAPEAPQPAKPAEQSMEANDDGLLPCPFCGSDEVSKSRGELAAAIRKLKDKT